MSTAATTQAGVREDAALSMEELEVLDKSGASNELFEWWEELETRTARRVNGSIPLPRTVREMAIRYIERMAKEVGLSRSSFFLCVALMDAFCNQHGHRSRVQDTPSVCAAVVGVVMKEESATVHVVYADLVEQALQFRHWLNSSGYVEAAERQLVALTDLQIQDQERDILDVLGWIVRIPSIETWTMAMMSRLHIVTRWHYVQPIQSLWQSRLVHSMRLIMMRQAASLELSWRSAACGLLSLGLVGYRLLPSVALKSDHVSLDDWDSLLLAGNLPNGCVQPPAVHPEECRLLLGQLMFATGRDLPAIRTDCEKVAYVLKDAMADIRVRQAAQAVIRASV